MPEQPSVEETGLIDAERVRERVQAALTAAKARGWSDDDLAAVTRIHARRIRSYRTEGRLPTLPALLSLGVVLKLDLLNPLLSLAGISGQLLDDAGQPDPRQIVADGLREFTIIAEAAADGRIDHTEAPRCKDAADKIIATVLPLSSAGER